MEELDGFPPVSDDTIGSVYADDHGMAYSLQWVEDVVADGQGAFCWVPLGRLRLRPVTPGPSADRRRVRRPWVERGRVERRSFAGPDLPL
ncbi:MAG: hypothetical protein JWL64_2590 [Frankiales bacterium]|nr:hypothetical protein [Frankiales bacterium]